MVVLADTELITAIHRICAELKNISERLEEISGYLETMQTAFLGERGYASGELRT